jgi:hypothetical protein
MQLSSDSDLHGSSDHTNHGIYISPSTSASPTRETETSEDGLDFGRSSVQSSWLQLELPSEESSEMRSDAGDDKIHPTLWSSDES